MTHEFKALPLEEVRVAITFVPSSTLSSAQVARLAIGLPKSVEWASTHVPLSEKIEFRFGDEGVFCSFDGIKLDLVWKRIFERDYPRFETVRKLCVDVARFVEAPVQIVSMTYVVIEQSMRPTFDDVSDWLDIGVSGPFGYTKFHNHVVAGRIDEANMIDLSLGLYRFDDKGVVVETSCGLYTSDIDKGLGIAHDTLIDFFGKVIKEKARKAWQLQ